MLLVSGESVSCPAIMDKWNQVRPLSRRSWSKQAHSQQVFFPLKKNSNTKTSFTSDYIKWKCLRAKNARGHATADRTKCAVQAEFPTKTKRDHATQIVPFFESRKCHCIKRRANQITALITLFSDTQDSKTETSRNCAHTHTIQPSTTTALPR